MAYGARHVAGTETVASLKTSVKILQHALGHAAGGFRAFDHNDIAVGDGSHLQFVFENGKIRIEFAQQVGQQAIIGEVKLHALQLLAPCPLRLTPVGAA